MPTNRNSFSDGMNQDLSNARQSGKNYYKGVNIKILTEEGSSSGDIENQDGNKVSFNIPDTFGFWRVRFTTPEDPDSGNLTITYIDPVTSLSNSFTTALVDSIEDLAVEINSGISSLVGTNVKVIKNGQFIYIIPLDSTLTSVSGTLGLDVNNGDYHVEPQTGLKIIGWGTLRDEVIVFTTNETSSTPSSAGQIWKFSYNPITKTIDNIGANNTLSIKDHLIYNNLLNLSTHWHIGTEVIGHYENSKIGRVYFTDEYNNLRSFNALDPDLMGVSTGQFNIAESINFSMPVVTGVNSTGTLPNGASVQYAYRLFSAGGRISGVSPVTNPIPLGDFDPSVNTKGNRAYEANGTTSTTGGKAVTLDISNIDPEFNYIELIAIITPNTGIKEIYKFDEVVIPADGNITVVHSDRGLDIPITPLEFAQLTRSFKRCKTITVKDKRLIAGNVDVIDTSLDGFDTRVYRFNNSRSCFLDDKESPTVTLTAPNPVYTNVPEEHDAINIYNATPDDDLTAVEKYKYQQDGVTLGGSGKNISYKFTTQDITLRATLSGKTIPTGNTSPASTYLTGNGEYNTKAVNRNSQTPVNGAQLLNGEIRGAANEFQNFLSPTMTGAFTGLARGEVYRFGIAFFDLEGNPYNTKWIGDIKVPEAYEKVGNDYPYSITGDAITDEYSSPVIGRSIGIEFTIDVSDIQDNVSGYEIVRVKREEKDKTRLGTGIWNNFTNAPVSSRRKYAPVNGSYAKDIFGNYSWINTSTTNKSVDSFLNISGTQKSCYILDDTPRLGSIDVSNSDTGVIISPTSLCKGSGYSYKTSDKIRTLGFYQDLYEAGSEYQKVNAQSSADGDSVAGYLQLGRKWETSDNSRELRTITKQKIMEPGEVITTGYGKASVQNPIVNCSPPIDNRRLPSGIGDRKQIVELDSRFTYYEPNVVGQYFPVTLTYPEIWRWREVSYERTLSNQYGGNTFEARSRNEYIATGSFESIKDYYSSTRTRVVFGGDAFVTAFNYQYYFNNLLGTDELDNAIGKERYHLGMSFPCETPINTEYQNIGTYGDENFRTWLSGGNAGFSQIGSPATYEVAIHYRKQNEARNIYYPKDFIESSVEEFPHRLWASNKKSDGELLDSWKVFLINNYTEVEGQYGQINKITTLKDRFFFYQDRAMGIATINDRSVINDENGVALTIGNGGILDDFGYISRNTGTKHKFSVVSTGSSIHHFDGILKKWMIYTGNPMPMSDLKGLRSHFLEYNGELLISDKILEGRGVHGMFDRVRNLVYMTFLHAKSTAGQIVSGIAQPNTIDNYTIVYDEYLQCYREFSDRIPSLWLETDGKLLTCEFTRSDVTKTYDPLNTGYIEYEGNKNNFYGIVYPSVIEIIINPQADITCVMNNIEYKSEIFINDIDQPSLTFDNIRVSNNHQDSGTIPLIVDSNVIRKIRTWRLNVPRDNAVNDPRMRDYFMKLVLTHKPDNNERLVLKDIITSFSVMPH